MSLYKVEDIPFIERPNLCHRTKSKEEIIEELEEKVAFYKSELGLQIENTHIHLLCRTLNIRPGVAYFIMALYNAKCRVLSWDQLEEIIPGQHYENEDRNTRNVLSVYSNITKKVLGEKSIDIAWGTGYCITVLGKNKVNEILYQE